MRVADERFATFARAQVLALVIGAGCAGSAPSVARAPGLDAEVLGTRAPVGRLLSLVPPDVTLVVRARPAALFAEPATARLISAVFEAERLDAFAARTGVDPRALDELVLAVHPEGRLVLARGPFDAVMAVREAGERMAPLESSTDRPWARRAGFLGARRIELVALAADAVLWVDGPPQLTANVLAAARRPEGVRSHALASDEVAELLGALGEVPLLAVAPQPLGLPGDTGIGVVLARERALAVSLHAVGSERLALRAELRGEFPPGVEQNLTALARSLAETDLGGVLGLRDALPSLRVTASDAAVRLGAEVPAGVLASGLRALLSAEIEELLEDGPTGPGTSEGAEAGGSSARADPHVEERAE